MSLSCLKRYTLWIHWTAYNLCGCCIMHHGRL